MSNQNFVVSMNSSLHRIKLALVAHRFEIGGLERCMATLVNSLPNDIVEPMVIAFDGECAAAEWITKENVKVASLKKGFPNDPRLALQLARTLREHEIDIVHSHNWGSLVESGIASRLCRIPHVHAEHGLEFNQNEQGWRGKIKPILKRRFFRKASALVAIADCVKRRLSGVYGIDSGRVTLIPNGVPKPSVGDRERNYCEVRQRLGLPGDARIAGTVGRAAHVKGFDNAIRAFHPLANQSSKNHLVIVGGGGEIDRLRELSNKLLIHEQVHLVGHQLDVGFWLSGFDLFFNSSRSEAMNLAVIEAMAVGLPIVAMDVGDNAVMVQKHMKCGLVAQQGDIDEFTRLLDIGLGDRGLSAEWGANSLAVYQSHYSVDKMTHAYLSLYQQLVAPRHPEIGGKLSTQFSGHSETVREFDPNG